VCVVIRGNFLVAPFLVPVILKILLALMQLCCLVLSVCIWKYYWHLCSSAA